MTIRAISTETAPAAIGPYSQAVVSGDLVFVSGQIPLNPTSGELVSGSIEDETTQVLTNLQAVLTAAGSSLSQVVKTTIYLTDLADFSRVNEVYARSFRAPAPARATVQVAALPRGARVEIDAIARLPEHDS